MTVSTVPNLYYGLSEHAGSLSYVLLAMIRHNFNVSGVKTSVSLFQHSHADIPDRTVRLTFNSVTIILSVNQTYPAYSCKPVTSRMT
jgi:hypothetical protein